MSKVNEFTRLAEETFASSINVGKHKLIQEQVISIKVEFTDTTVRSNKPFFAIKLEDLINNSEYFVIENYEITLFNESFGSTICLSLGIPKMSIALLLHEHESTLFFSRSQDILFEALNCASSYKLAG